MPDLRREFQKNVRLATHTALGELFIPDAFGKCKGVFTKLSLFGQAMIPARRCRHRLKKLWDARLVS